jgi:hypothetical protein
VQVAVEAQVEVRVGEQVEVRVGVQGEVEVRVKVREVKRKKPGLSHRPTWLGWFLEAIGEGNSPQT